MKIQQIPTTSRIQPGDLKWHIIDCVILILSKKIYAKFNYWCPTDNGVQRKRSIVLHKDMQYGPMATINLKLHSL